MKDPRILSVLVPLTFLTATGLYAAASENPNTMTVVIETNGQYSLCGTRIEKDVLEKVVAKTFAQVGEYPLIVKPAAGIMFSNVWPVVTFAARIGLFRSSIFTKKQRATVLIPTREGDNTKSSPVVMRGFKGNTVPKEVDCVRVTKRMMMLNDKVTNLAELDKYFAIRRDKNQTVMVMPSDDAPMDRVSDVLDVIIDTGNKESICLAAEERTAQQSSPDDGKAAPEK